jgi:protocatechuate 3,4-dioxygenase beta subunit
LETDHEGTINATLALESPADYVFNKTSSTVLNPQGEVGPFFVSGELVRSDIRNTEPGIEVVLEAQVVDISTCEPLAGVWLDIWSANSTGVYSGVHTNLNGNGADTSNLNNTALRGIQQTDVDGVAQFTTIFPGHYAGRATHLHAVLHENATLLPNNTLTGGTYPHIGQFFWDQKLINQVEATAPYNTNKQKVTLNRADRVFVQQETEGSDSDPVFNYVFFGEDLSDGMFSWIYLGINTSATYTPTYSFQYTDHGGEPATGHGGGGPGGGPPAK